MKATPTKAKCNFFLPLLVWQSLPTTILAAKFVGESNTNKGKKQLDSVCLQSVCFVKFKISKKGEPKEIGFNYGSDSLLNSVFNQIIIDSKQYWKPSIFNGKAIESSQIIMPIMVFYDKGCKQENLNDYKTKYLKFKRAVNHLTNYTKNEYYGGFYGGFLEECIILKPFIITNKTPNY